MSGGISKANLSPGDNRVVMSEAAAADAGETRPRQTPTLLCVRSLTINPIKSGGSAAGRRTADILRHPNN